jgi:hypothetical protein
MWIGVEAVTRVGRLKRLGWGSKFLALTLVGCFSNNLIKYFQFSHLYGPLLCAYFTKYQDFAKSELGEIEDEKREWFDIDTSQYMSYTHEDLGHEHHAHHGPQPDGEVLNGSWFTEMDKFLKGEASTITSHPQWTNYEFKYNDKGQWPSQEAIEATFTAKGTKQKTPESLK